MLTGHPALCLPNGFKEGESNTSITLLANLFDEMKLVLLGDNYSKKVTENLNVRRCLSNNQSLVGSFFWD